MIYLIKYRKELYDGMLNRKEVVEYSKEIEASDKKDAIKKISKKVELNNITAIYLKLN